SRCSRTHRKSAGPTCWSSRRSRTSWSTGPKLCKRNGRRTATPCARGASFPDRSPSMPMPVLSTELDSGAVQTPTRSAAIAATGLRKSFDDKVVLDGVDLTIASGTVFALLGPNGAGKTTMVNIFATLLEADAGQVQIAGHDLARDPEGV